MHPAARCQRLRKAIEKYQTRLTKIRNARLAFALLFIASAVVATAFPQQGLALLLVAVFLPVFLVLVVISRRIEKHLGDLDAHLRFYERQSLRQKGTAPIGHWETDTPSTVLETDLNLTGPKSLFTFLDETFSPGGAAVLLRHVLAIPEQLQEIRQRQHDVRTLAGFYGFLSRTVNLGKLLRVGRSQDEIDHFLKTPFLPASFARTQYPLYASWLVFVTALALSMVVPSRPGIFWAIYAMLALLTLAQTGSAFQRAQNILLHLSAWRAVFGRLENPELNKDLKPYLAQTQKNKPHRRLSKLEFYLSCLSVQAHPLVSIIVNVLLPWSTFFAARTEKSREQLTDLLPGCLDEAYNLEFLSSLVFLYRDQTRTFPVFHEEPRLTFTGLYHPMLKRETAVSNDFSYGPGQRLALITGSNMSGKSTFLRTVGVNQILANMGAPVFALSFNTFAAEACTSIQISDSMEQGLSHFYNEVLQLKNLLQKAQRRPVLYLVDEIFQGTNNRERHIGSQSVIAALTKTQSLGFLSTHDLELTQMSSQIPAIGNWHFRETVDHGRMAFSYKIHPGPCPTTNALQIMKDAGLPVP